MRMPITIGAVAILMASCTPHPSRVSDDAAGKAAAECMHWPAGTSSQVKLTRPKDHADGTELVYDEASVVTVSSDGTCSKVFSIEMLPRSGVQGEPVLELTSTDADGNRRFLGTQKGLWQTRVPPDERAAIQISPES